MPQPSRNPKPPTQPLAALPPELQLMSPGMAAQVLDTTVATLASWRFDQLGPAYVKIGSLVRYPVADLQAWIAGRTVRHPLSA